MPKQDVQLGDVILMRGFKDVRVGEKVEATFTFRAEKDRYDVFMFLGSVTRDGLKEYKPDAVLEAIGWKFAGDDTANADAAIPSQESEKV